MKKRIFPLFFLFACLYANIAFGQAQTINQQVLTNITITDGDGHLFTPDNPPYANSNVRIHLEWMLNHSWNVQNGDYYVYQVPPYFTVHNTVDGTLSDSTTQVNYGSFHLSLDGKLKIIFNNNAVGKDIKGDLFLKTSFNQITIKQNDTIKTGINDELGREIIIILNFKTGSIKKTGALDGNNNIKWSVTVNESLDQVTEAVLTDTVPAGLTYTSYYLSSGENLKSATCVPISGGRSLLTLKWSAINNKAVTATYYTAIANPSIGTFTNSAQFSGDNILPANAQASVNVNAATIDKKLVSYDAATGKMKWEIQYYATINNAWVIDQLWKNTSDKGNHYLVAGSVNVATVNTGGVETAYNSWAFDASEDEKDAANHIIKFKIDFKNTNIPVLFKVRYTTQATIYPIVNSTTFNNTVKDGGKSASGSNTVTITTINKVGNNIYYSDSTLQWTTTINESKIRMNNLVLVDTFQTSGMSFIENSLVVKANGSTLTKNTDYAVTPYNGSYQKGFLVTFLGSNTSTKRTFTLEYLTKFDINALPAGVVKFTNRSIADYTDSLTKQRKDGKSASIEIDNFMKYNGQKSGLFIPRGTTYAAAPFDNGKEYTSTTNGSILWNVSFNYTRQAIQDAVITDVLKDKQHYASGTLQVWSMKIGIQGALTRDFLLTEGTDYSFANVTGNPNADDTIKIVFKKGLTTIIRVYFVTTLDNSNQQQETYNNTATLTSLSHNPYSWTGTVKVTTVSRWVEKEGRQGDQTKGEDPFKIYWTVLVNKDSAIVADAALKDSLDSKQKLVTTNGNLDLYVFKAKKQGTGFVKDGQALVEGVNYIVDYSGAKANGSETFVVKFINPNPISQPYIVEYQSHILVSNNDIIKNHVSFTGTGLTPISSTKTIIIKLTTAKGNACGQTGSITIKKTDIAGNILDGAVFELYSSSNMLTRTITTGEEGTPGEITITNLNFDTYKIKEIQAPSKYRLDTTLRWTSTISEASPYDTVSVINILKSPMAQARKISVNGDVVTIERDSVTYNYTLKCGADTALVIGVAEDFGTVWFDGSNTANTIYFPSITRAGLKVVPFKVISEDGSITKDYILNLYHPFKPEIVVQLWDDVLTVNNNPDHNEGYSINGYQWYKNGTMLQGEAGNLLRVPEKLQSIDAYHAMLTTVEGWSAPSCPMHPTASTTPTPQGTMIAFPNPVKAGQLIRVQTGLRVNHTEKAALQVFDLKGTLVYTKPVSGPEIDLYAPFAVGSYLLKIQTSGEAKTFTIVVTP